MTHPAHDFADPVSQLNMLEAAKLAADLEHRCPHCDVHTEVIAMTGTGWGVESFHESRCPDHDDNLPTPERPTGGGAS